MLYPELTPESHASSSIESLQEKSEGLPIPYDLPPNVMDSNSEPARSVERFAAWAMAETDATTIGEAISYVVNGDVEDEEWRDFAQLELQHFSEPPQHPYAIIDVWVDQLPARDRRIFNFRIADMGGGLTLQELADDFGITRERVRQLGSRLHRKFSEFVETPDGLPVRWRMHSLRRRIGVAIPAFDLDPMLTTEDDDTRYGSLLLRFAGPYEPDNEWRVLSSEVGRDPTAAIKGTADEYGRIDRGLASELLSKWGLERSLHEGWLTRDGSIRSINGQLVAVEGFHIRQVDLRPGRYWQAGHCQNAYGPHQRGADEKLGSECAVSGPKNRTGEQTGVGACILGTPGLPGDRAVDTSATGETRQADACQRSGRPHE